MGLEALSRGCQESHFVEMDPAVARDCLHKNIAACGLTSQSHVHTMVMHQAPDAVIHLHLHDNRTLQNVSLEVCLTWAKQSDSQALAEVTL